MHALILKDRITGLHQVFLVTISYISHFFQSLHIKRKSS